MERKAFETCIIFWKIVYKVPSIFYTVAWDLLIPSLDLRQKMLHFELSVHHILLQNYFSSIILSYVQFTRQRKKIKKQSIFGLACTYLHCHISSKLWRFLSHASLSDWLRALAESSFASKPLICCLKLIRAVSLWKEIKLKSSKWLLNNSQDSVIISLRM